MTAASRSKGAAGEESGDLLERSAELDVLHRGFEGARRGAGTTVMICGPTGMGKTSLVQRFLTDLDEPTVFWGGCDDLIAPRSFGPFRDMIHASGLLSDELAVDPNRENLLVSLLSVLDRPSRPAVVVVEDAHWADDASIDVMRYLTRRLVSMHAMLIVTMRDGDVSRCHPVRGLLTGSTSSAPTRVNLGPLSLDAVRSLARDSVLDAGYVHEVSGGNPLLVRQLLSADPDDATRLAQETLVARAERLSAEGRSALQALSVLPQGADPALARTLFEDRPEVLHEAESSGLLEATTTHLRFRHELGRSAVVNAMSFGERMAATNKVLAALSETGADPTLLAHIARAAGDGPRATRFALEVLDQGLAPSNHEGVWTLARIALECTTDLTAARIAWLHSTAARAGWATSHHTEALHHAERAVHSLARDRSEGGTDERPGDEPLATAWLTLAMLQADAGDHLRARAALRNAKELLDQGPAGEDWVRCNTGLAAAALIGGEPDRSMELATESIELAEANAWTQELVNALGVRGSAAGGPVTPGDLDDLERAIELGAVHGPPDGHAANLLSLSDRHLRSAQTAEAERRADEAERHCREHGLGQLHFRAQVQRVQVFIQQGRTAEAVKLATELVRDGSDPGVIRTSAEAARARILNRRADERAAELVERAWSGAVATGEIEKMAFAGVTRLEHLWVQDDEEELRQFARYLVGLGRRHRHHRLRADALRVLQRLGDDVGPFDGCPAPLAAALAGDHRRAAELWEEAGQPYERALELVESTDAAVAFEGLRLLDRAGATRIADLVRQRLRGRGLPGVPRGPRKSSDGAVPVLTGRQVDVLRLIARGHTNQEIADELFVARRTVDNHVSAILSRLGVDRRHEAVDEAVSRGLIAVQP